jgi:hypothetical protein
MFPVQSRHGMQDQYVGRHIVCASTNRDCFMLLKEGKNYARTLLSAWTYILPPGVAGQLACHSPVTCWRCEKTFVQLLRTRRHCRSRHRRCVWHSPVSATKGGYAPVGHIPPPCRVTYCTPSLASSAALLLPKGIILMARFVLTLFCHQH